MNLRTLQSLYCYPYKLRIVILQRYIRGSKISFDIGISPSLSIFETINSNVILESL